MQVPLPGRRREHDGARHPVPEQLRRRVDVLRIDAAAVDELHPLEGVAVAVERELRLGPVRRVVVDRQRHVGAEDRLEVEHVAHLVEAEEATVRPERPRVALRVEQRRRGQERREPGERLPARHSLTPALLDLAHGGLL